MRSVIDDLHTPVVLCGHSYRGVVITEVSAGQARVRHLVYIAAEIPDEKETIMTYSAYSKPELMEAFLFRDGIGFPDLERTPLFWDCDPEVRDSARSRLRPMSMRIADPGQTPTGVGRQAVRARTGKPGSTARSDHASLTSPTPGAASHIALARKPYRKSAT